MMQTAESYIVGPSPYHHHPHHPAHPAHPHHNNSRTHHFHPHHHHHPHSGMNGTSAAVAATATAAATAYIPRYSSCQRRGPHISYDNMPSISPPVAELENGAKEAYATPYELGPWSTSSAKLSADDEFKVFGSILTTYMGSGDSVVPCGMDNSVVEYSLDNGYNQCITNSWEGVHPLEWTPSQVMEWLYTVFSHSKDFEKLPLDKFQTIRGSQLIQYKKSELISLLRSSSSPDYDSFAEECSERLYAELQHLQQNHHHLTGSDCSPPSAHNNINNNCNTNNNHQLPCTPNDHYQPFDTNGTSDYAFTGEGIFQYESHKIFGQSPQTTTQTQYPYEWNSAAIPGGHAPGMNDGGLNGQLVRGRSDIDSEEDSGESILTVPPYSTISSHPRLIYGDKPPKRGPGRPPGDRKKKAKGSQRSSRLWEFIRDLLKNKETCPRLVKWEDREEGIFRFVQSDQVAKLWGERKSNPRMTYEKLSRAMRYYYKSNVLQPVLGRRLVYKFGPCATGWRIHEL